MRRLLPLGVSLVILAAIYARLDVREVGRVLAASQVTLIAAGLALEVALTVVAAWRFTRLMPAEHRAALGDVTRLSFAGCSLNVFLPFKLGDATKALATSQGARLDLGTGLSLVLLEKVFGFLALFTWGCLGLLLAPAPPGLGPWLLAMALGGLALGGIALASNRPALGAIALVARLAPGRAPRWLALEHSWASTADALRADRGRFALVAALSLGIWLGHFFALWLFTLAVNATVPFLAHLAIAAIALLAGMLPLTFIGAGPRDAAIIVLYAPFMAPPTAAAFALLCTCRYLACALVGLPFLPHAIGRLGAQAPPAGGASVELSEVAFSGHQ